MRLDFFPVSLTELGIDLEVGEANELDPAGDFTVEPLVTSMVESDVLHPASAPGAGDYPEADYVVKSTDDQVGEVYYYFMNASQPIFLGTGGAELPSGFSDLISSPTEGSDLDQFQDFYPLTFGKSLAPIQVPVDIELLGLRMTGTYDMVGEVDAWGQVSVPAGTFDALRLHVGIDALLNMEAEGEEPLILAQRIDQWAWFTPRIGQVALVQQATTQLPEGIEGVEELIFAQVLRSFCFLRGVDDWNDAEAVEQLARVMETVIPGDQG